MEKLRAKHLQMVETGQMITQAGAVFIGILFMYCIYTNLVDTPSWDVRSPNLIKFLLIVCSISSVVLSKAASILIFVWLDGRSGFYSRERLFGYNLSIFVRIAFLCIPGLSGFILTLMTQDMLWISGLGLGSVYAMFKQWPNLKTVQALYPGSDVKD